MNERLRIAIVGGGAAGLSAAHVLARHHQVTLFEREPQLGGHVQTFVVNDGPDTGIALDMAFMLLSDRHYPTFKRLLAQLGIEVATGDMSFGYDAPFDGIQYVINWRADDPFTRSTNLRGGGSPDRRDAPMGRLFEPALRFCFQAPRDLRSGFLVGKTLTEYCRARGFPDELLTHYLGPLGAVGWSLPPSSIEAFPAELYVSFFDHHDLFTLTGGAVWQGRLFVTGRLDDLIIIDGRNHYPHDIEQSVESSHPRLAGRLGAAFAVEDGGEPHLVILQESDVTDAQERAEVTRAIRTTISELHGLNARTVVLVASGAIPRTTSGKVRRAACRKGFLEGAAHPLAPGG